MKPTYIMTTGATDVTHIAGFTCPLCNTEVHIICISRGSFSDNAAAPMKLYARHVNDGNCSIEPTLMDSNETWEIDHTNNDHKIGADNYVKRVEQFMQSTEFAEMVLQFF